MQKADAIVVGGGPAGSTCAWKLREAGLDVLVLDRAAFPRTKLCAGWVTPEALQDLELDPGDYPHSFITFDELHLHWKVFTAKPATRQHSIRRYEFDDFLLRRAGARVMQHKVRDIQRENGDDVERIVGHVKAVACRCKRTCRLEVSGLFFAVSGQNAANRRDQLGARNGELGRLLLEPFLAIRADVPRELVAEAQVFDRHLALGQLVRALDP